MSPNPISEELLAEMLAGLEGVTPGPWYTTGAPWFSGNDGVLAGSPDGNIAYLIADCDDGMNPRNEYVEGHGPFPLGDKDADAAHIARCDPDTIRAIITELQDRRSAPAVVTERNTAVALDCLRHLDDEIKLVPAKPDPVTLNNLTYWASQLRAALSVRAEPVAVKPMDMSNLLRHAFLAGRGLSSGDKLSDEDLAAWVGYDPEGTPAYERIRSALVKAPAPAVPDGWRPIETADRSIAVDMQFPGAPRMLHSYPIWVRCNGGEPFEASWCQRKPDNPAGYWWAWDAEEVCDPDEWMPHPLAAPSQPQAGGGE